MCQETELRPSVLHTIGGKDDGMLLAQLADLFDETTWYLIFGTGVTERFNFRHP